MPQIVGIHCTNGVVLAASGSGDNDASIVPRRARSLRVISGQAVLGVSGHEGLAQEMTLALEGALVTPERGDGSELSFRNKLREALAGPIQRGMALQRSLDGIPDSSDTDGSRHICTGGIVALPFRRALRLYVLDSACALTELTEERPCAAVGAGRGLTEAFLRFLARNLWQAELPSVRQAEVAACWALVHAQADGAGTREPRQLVAMSRAGDGSIQIEELGEEGLAALRRAVREAEEAFRAAAAVGIAQVAEPPSGNNHAPVRKRVPEVRLTLERPDSRRGFMIR